MKKIIAFYFILALGILSGCQKTETKVTPPITTSVSDFDGNHYRVRSIGGKEWMTENLKVTHFNNGDTIPEVRSDFNWIGLSSPGWCSYDNDSSNSRIYGNLYNQYVATDSRGVCPDGYHVPTDSELFDLITSLGSSSPGQELKAIDSTWDVYSVSIYNTNSSGFTALPAGYRDYSPGQFSGLHASTAFWSSTTWTLDNSPALFLNNQVSSASVGQTQNRNGFSIRCVKN